MDHEAAGMETSHDVACGAAVNNEPTIIDCKISTIQDDCSPKTGADVSKAVSND